MKSVVVLAALVLCAFSAKYPQNALRDVQIFDPAPLPCAYTVFFTMSMDFGGHNLVKKGREMVYGRNIASLATMSMEGNDVLVYELLRADMKESEDKPNGAAEFSFYDVPEEQTCSGRFIDDITHGIVDGVHTLLAARLYYTTKNTGVTYNGEVCDELIFEQNGELVGNFYVNKDNRIVGYYDVKADKNVNLTYSLVAYESDFILPSEATGCSTFEKAFQAPDAEPNCAAPKVRPSSSTTSSSSDSYASAASSEPNPPPPVNPSLSAASTIKACATFVFAIMMVAAISLF